MQSVEPKKDGHSVTDFWCRVFGSEKDSVIDSFFVAECLTRPKTIDQNRRRRRRDFTSGFRNRRRREIWRRRVADAKKIRRATFSTDEPEGLKNHRPPRAFRPATTFLPPKNIFFCL